MSKKIDDNLNDLFGIKLIFLTIRVEYSEFVWTLRSLVSVVFKQFSPYRRNS